MQNDESMMRVIQNSQIVYKKVGIKGKGKKHVITTQDMFN